MARATGVHVTGSAVRVVDIDGSPKKFRIRGFGDAAIEVADEEEREIALSRAMKEAFKAAKANRDHVILGVPIRDCIIREITIPFIEPEQIRKVIKFESEPHLHSCSIDEVVVCFHPVAQQGNRTTVLVIAARKEKIREALGALERIGVDPLSVDVDVSGLFALTAVLDQTDDLERYVICEIGYTSTLILLVVGGRLRLVRAVRMGTDSISSRVGKDLDIDTSEARTRTQAILAQDLALEDDLLVRAGDVLDSGDETSKTSGELERDIIRQRQEELVGRLHQEINRTLNPAKLEAPLECIFLTGQGSRLPRLQAQLADRSGTPVRQLELLDQMEHDFPDAEVAAIDATVAIGAGLALKHVGADPLHLEFRQEEFVFARKFDRLKVPLLCLVILLTTLNGLWYLLEKRLGGGRAGTVNGIAAVASGLFEDIANPERIRPNLKEVIDYDDQELSKIFLGARDLEGRERIDYISRQIREMNKRLREAYSLRTQEDKRRGPRTRKGSDKDEIPDDVSGFVSALRRWEQVFKAVSDTGVRDITVNKLRATSSEVRIGLTIPEESETRAGRKNTLEILNLIQENLKALPPEEKFVEIDAGRPTPRNDGHGVDYPTIVISFAKERK